MSGPVVTAIINGIEFDCIPCLLTSQTLDEATHAHCALPLALICMPVASIRNKDPNRSLTTSIATFKAVACALSATFAQVTPAGDGGGSSAGHAVLLQGRRSDKTQWCEQNQLPTSVTVTLHTLYPLGPHELKFYCPEIPCHVQIR
jgi:hypothetical protein